MTFTLDIDGMHCKSCVMLITDELEENGATHVQVTLDAQHKRGTASGEHEHPDTLIPKIEALGAYKAKRRS